MRLDFENWLSEVEDKEPSTINSYATAINRISRHYSLKIGKNIDIYQLNDILILKSICKEYEKGGKYADFGEYGHGTNRAAINSYVRYIETIKKVTVREMRIIMN
jgi:hypothetical protein